MPAVLRSRGTLVTLLSAAHLGPTVAVTLLSALLAIAADLSPARVLLVVAAVLTGQLSIGWSNDLVDAGRDRRVGRTDKPLARGAVSLGAVRRACAAALVATVVLSLACGLAAGVAHLVLVASGWAYNLGLKSTVVSWLPYFVAFGALPVFVSLAQTPADFPALWMPLAGGLLGVGAHLVNVLPDLAEDAATGVRGLPHRLGERWTPPAAVSVLALASVAIAVGTTAVPGLVVALAMAAVLVLAVLALTGSGRTPFRAAIGIALVDVLLLVWAR